MVNLASIEADKVRWGFDLYKRNYPIWKEYISQRGIETIDILEDCFNNKREVIKFINILLTYNNKMNNYFGKKFNNKNHPDFATSGDPCQIPSIGYSEYYLSIKSFENLVRLLKFNKIFKLLKMIIDKGVDLHEWIANLPKIHLDDEPETLFYILKRFIRFKKEIRYEMMGFMNYKKVREAKNYKEALVYIRVVKMAKNNISKANIIAANMSICDLYNGDNADNIYIDRSKILQFSKDPFIVGSIGQETHCCFKRNGLAASLLEPTLKSPIGGIIHGYRPYRYFAMVWEMVVLEDGIFKKRLILDNIEAVNRLPVEFYESMEKMLSKCNYSKIHLGTSRNDISLPDRITKNKIEKDDDYDVMNSAIIKKPILMVGYESNFKKYGSYDDSSNLYTLIEKEDDINVILHRMVPGDLHRCKYIEQRVYDEPDKEFLEIDVTASPSYVWESKTGIYGYFITRLKWYYDTCDKFEQHQDLSKSEFKKVIKKNKEKELPPTTGLVKVLYLEDIYLLPFKKIKLSAIEAFNDLINWCKKNDIIEISGSMNDTAKNFDKRIINAGFNYHPQENTPKFNAYLPKAKAKLTPSSVNIYFSEEEKCNIILPS